MPLVRLLTIIIMISALLLIPGCSWDALQESSPDSTDKTKASPASTDSVNSTGQSPSNPVQTNSTASGKDSSIVTAPEGSDTSGKNVADNPGPTPTAVPATDSSPANEGKSDYANALSNYISEPQGPSQNSKPNPTDNSPVINGPQAPKPPSAPAKPEIVHPK